MTLTEEQKNNIQQWVSANMTLSQIQERLQDQFKISMTYMDLRFLIDDLDIELPKKEVEDVSADEQTNDLPEEMQDEVGGVTLSIDAVQRPGVALGGSVTFSDGVTAKWQIDSMGQLGIIPDSASKDYHPSPEDIQEFQLKLRDQLQSKGM